MFSLFDQLAAFVTPIFAAGAGNHTLAIFFTQIACLILVGRFLSEVMQRVGQPAVMGQLIAGILLGPSVFGAIWPSMQATIFPASSAGRPMLTAVSELGVLMLLLLTGMETDLALIKRVRKQAGIVSAAGIVIPFICGYLLGEFLPASVLPDPDRRIFTSLFLATALSISSVKIVAAVLREVDFLRRDLGQMILASAILDDTIGWTILAVIGGLAAHGKVMLEPLVISVGGTIAFLVICFTVGHRWVARLIRWANDRLISEMPVISVILVLMFALALFTDLIGVHTVLGAFVAGIMIGQSPILTKHIEQELRGLIVALFMPVFFGVAGLSINLRVLADPDLLWLAVIVIGVASIGKLGGCYFGGRIAKLGHHESLAIGFGMNARGSTEIILATIGLTMGVLNQRLFTIIVLMAVVTTLFMPPLLRWALAQVVVDPEEELRLKGKEAEEKDHLPKVDRILVGVDGSAEGLLASRLVGWLVGARRLMTTVIDADKLGEDRKLPSPPLQEVTDAANEAASAIDAGIKEEMEDTPPSLHSAMPLKSIEDLISSQPMGGLHESKNEDVITKIILAEAQNGYGLVFLGLGIPRDDHPLGQISSLDKIVRDLKQPMAILLRAEAWQGSPDTPLKKILVPTTSADYSRFGAEVAVAIAKGCGATITALHVSVPATDSDLIRRPDGLLRTGRALLTDIVNLGRREKVRVSSKSMFSPFKERAILRRAHLGGYQLIVLGTKTRLGPGVDFGQSVEALLENAPCPVLIVKS